MLVNVAGTCALATCQDLKQSAESVDKALDVMSALELAATRCKKAESSFLQTSTDRLLNDAQRSEVQQLSDQIERPARVVDELFKTPRLFGARVGSAERLVGWSVDVGWPELLQEEGPDSIDGVAGILTGLKETWGDLGPQDSFEGQLSDLTQQETEDKKVAITRTFSDTDVRRTYGRLLSRAAAARVESSEVKLAKVAWEQALAAKARPGRPPAESKAFETRSEAILLIYQSITCLTQWARFACFVAQNLPRWKVNHWCATLETCKNGRLHIHLMVQLHKARDCTSRAFAFEGIPPNTSAHDYLGEGMGRRNPQQSIDRGFFYVFASKLGTAKDEFNQECVVGNYEM
eukprot:Skav235947  [mRNA]  locus=scaffold3392:100856:112339:- [translate_table: standard]